MASEGGDVVEPYYSDSHVTIYHGDALEMVDDLPSADLLLMDPPFFMPAQHYAARRDWQKTWGDTEVLRRWWAGALSELLRRLKGTGSAFVFCDGESYPVFYPDMYRRFHAVSGIVWDKGRIGMGTPWRHSFELLIHGRQADSKWCGSGGQTDVLRHPPVPSSERFHPVDKPVGLLAELIGLVTEPNDTVCDPFMGGGSAIEAAASSGRKAIGIEIEERYCEIAAERCSQGVLDLGGAA